MLVVELESASKKRINFNLEFKTKSEHKSRHYYCLKSLNNESKKSYFITKYAKLKRNSRNGSLLESNH